MGETMEVREGPPEYGPKEERIPPGYKRTEVGVIPEEWALAPMRELYTLRNGVNADKSAYGSGVPFVNVLEVVENSHLGVAQIPGRVGLPEAVRAEFDLRTGDLVFNRTSETQEEVGLAAAYCGSPSITFGGFVIRARPTTDRIDSVFAGYSLRHTMVHSQVVRRGQGAIRANIGQADLKTVVVPIPPLPEQRAIARALSDVDDLISALDKLIEKKRAIKQATMQQLLTGRTRLPGFGGEWQKALLGDIGELSKGQGIARGDVVADGLPCIRYGELYTHYRYWTVDIVSRVSARAANQSRVIHEGDLLFAGSGETAAEIGACVAYLGDEIAYAGGDIIVLTPDRDDSRYLGYLLNHEAIAAQKARMAQGDAVVHISARDLGRVEINLPPLPEQRAIVAVLSDMDAGIVALERRREKTRLLKQGMMQELLTGRIRLVEVAAG